MNIKYYLTLEVGHKLKWRNSAFIVVLHSFCVLKCYAFSFNVDKLVPCYSKINIQIWGSRGRHRMVVGYTRSGRDVQHYVI